MSPVAAVDIGSISTRLLIGGPDGPIERHAEVTGLGRGIGERGALSPEGVEAALAVLEQYRRRCDERGVSAIRAVATAALRAASDGEAFLDRAAGVLGARPEVITADEEGRLSFAGATAGADPAEGPFCVIDLGGGSTEVALGAESCTGVLSLDIGAQALSERYITSDPPGPDELVACLSLAEAHLDDVVRLMPEVRDTTRFFGLAGTFCTLAAVEIGLATYDGDRVEGFVLDKDAAEDVFRTLVTESRADRAHNPGLPPERVDSIVGGACIAVAAMRFFSIEEITVTERDLLDGIVARLLAGG
ncbi:MAG: exopolyphosphatase [Actinomycetota bacterium]|nr:exopolyphosphatase [Actinomycetota bacterium]